MIQRPTWTPLADLASERIEQLLVRVLWISAGLSVNPAAIGTTKCPREAKDQNCKPRYGRRGVPAEVETFGRHCCQHHHADTSPSESVSCQYSHVGT